MRPSSEEGDGDQAGLKIVLTDNPKPPVAMKVSPTLKAAQAKPKKAKGEWGVQVGAFKSKSLANEQLMLVRSRFSKFVADAEGAVEGAASSTFRAQFQGMTAEAARGLQGDQRQASALHGPVAELGTSLRDHHPNRCHPGSLAEAVRGPGTGRMRCSSPGSGSSLRYARGDNRA